MKKISKRILSLFLALIMLISVAPAGTISAQAAGDTYLQYNATLINSIGKQARSMCSAYALAYCRAILDNKKANPYSYWNSGCQWPRGNYYISNSSNPCKTVCEYINRGKPTIIHLTGTSSAGHYVTVVGYKSGTNINSARLADLIFIDPYDCKLKNGSSTRYGLYGDGKIILPNNKNGSVKVTNAPPTGSAPSNGSGTINNTTTSTKNNYYNSSASYQGQATYRNTCGYNVNIRTGVGTNNRSIGVVPNGQSVYINQTQGNWGYGSYGGKTGWICLDYFTKQSVPEATTPSINATGNGHVAVKERITVSWASNNASRYDLSVTGVETKTYSGLTSNSQEIILNNVGTYYFKVKAYNSVGKETSWSTTISCVSERDRHVKFVDWDNTALEEFDVKYGHNAPTPKSPSRKGYTFEGWDSSYFNITADKTIKAKYKIIIYTVNFFDRTGKLIGSPQKVEYGHDATPPTDVNTEANYVFKGWNSTAYKNVYTDRSDKCINIDGIYAWDNYDLPVRCKNAKAERDFFGYNVTVDVENNDSKPTNGRIVVALKTSEGKLVEMTESSAFAIKAGKTKTGCEVYVSCQKPAAKVEVFMVTNYATGIPISPILTTEITEGLMYAESTIKPNESEVTDLQEVTQYKYREKEFKTGNTKTLAGYEYTGKRNENLISQSGWIDNTLSTYDNETEKRVLANTRTVNIYSTRTLTCFYHFYKRGGGNHTYCPTSHVGGTWHQINVVSSAMTHYGQSSDNSGVNKYRGPACPSCGASQYWFKSVNRNDDRTEQYVSGSKNQYSYNTYRYSYNFYRWKTWSDWSDTAVSATADRDVQTRKIYRYKSNVPQVEDKTGKTRTQSGKVDSAFAGKQLMLYVYGYTGASDYTNQFIGQTTVGADGSYSFTYKLRQEPTAQTGDYTIAIGIEGTSDITKIGTIEAPKPSYTVNFYDFDGNIIDTQTVQEGKNATVPESPEKTGYDFCGWDKSTTRIMENTDFYPEFEKKEFTVVFVDWQNQFLKVEKFKYGDALSTPDAKTVEGYKFVGWDNKSNIVTQDMVVTAQYEANKYKIEFVDQDGKVKDTQYVDYGDTAIVPDDIKGDNITFDGWMNEEESTEVTHDAKIYPEYHFDEDTEVPIANYQSGEYTSELSLQLTTKDENAVIYYYLDGNEHQATEYTGPIKLDKTHSVTYYASSLGKNDSEEVTNYYCINTSGNTKYHIVYYDEEGVSFVQSNTKLTPDMFEDEHYNFAGLYTDYNYTKEYNINTPVTSSIHLYIKYTPKQYSVIFNIEGGSILETQNVNYSESAKDPNVPKKAGYIFAGWDKDYSCVTEDMVVTGKYLKESEYAKISLDESSYDLYVNTSFALNPTITPFNLVGEEIEWTSSDSSIASVDSNGVVKGLKAGEATITATVKSSKSTASCIVTVKASAKKALLLNSDSKLNYDSLGYLRRIKPGTTSAEVAKEFVNTEIKFYDIDGIELTDTDYVGTGCKIQLVAGDNIIDSKTVVVTGDMNGDGIINNKDVAMMNKYLVEKVTANECQGLAIDVNGDGYINNRDAAMLARYLVGKETLNS